MLARLLLSPPACRDAALLRRAVAGQTILVTGASFGIGREVALLLADAGAKVLLTARSVEPLQELADLIAARGGQAEVYRADLAQPAEVEALIQKLRAEHPKLDAVVSNAGRSIRRSAYRSSEKRDLERSLAINFSGPAALILGLLPSLGSGSVIVNVSTVSVKPPGGPRWGSYQGSKAGFDLWLACLGAEVQASGVRVCSVYLPLTRTRMSAPTYGAATLALSARDAAQSVVDALVRPVSRIAPWWLAWQELGALLFPNVMRRALGLVERLDRWQERRR